MLGICIEVLLLSLWNTFLTLYQKGKVEILLKENRLDWIGSFGAVDV